MGLLLVLGVIVLSIGVAAGTALVIPAMFQGFRTQWERFPADARRRAAIAGAVITAYLVAGAALVIAEPWGRRSVLYVIGLGGGAVMLLGLIGVAGDAFRVRRRR